MPWIKRDFYDKRIKQLFDLLDEVKKTFDTRIQRANLKVEPLEDKIRRLTRRIEELEKNREVYETAMRFVADGRPEK